MKLQSGLRTEESRQNWDKILTQEEAMNQSFTNQNQGSIKELEKPLTLKDACKYLQCSASYLYKLTHKRQIPAYKPSGKKLYFKIADLNKWAFRNPITSDETKGVKDKPRQATISVFDSDENTTDNLTIGGSSE